MPSTMLQSINQNSVPGVLLTGLLCHDILTLHSYRTQYHKPRDATAPNEMCPTNSVSNQENVP